MGSFANASPVAGDLDARGRADARRSRRSDYQGLEGAGLLPRASARHRRFRARMHPARRSAANRQSVRHAFPDLARTSARAERQAPVCRGGKTKILLLRTGEQQTGRRRPVPAGRAGRSRAEPFGPLHGHQPQGDRLLSDLALLLRPRSSPRTRSACSKMWRWTAIMSTLEPRPAAAAAPVPATPSPQWGGTAPGLPDPAAIAALANALFRASPGAPVEPASAAATTREPNSPAAFDPAATAGVAPASSLNTDPGLVSVIPSHVAAQAGAPPYAPVCPGVCVVARLSIRRAAGRNSGGFPSDRRLNRVRRFAALFLRIAGRSGRIGRRCAGDCPVRLRRPIRGRLAERSRSCRAAFDAWRRDLADLGLPRRSGLCRRRRGGSGRQPLFPRRPQRARRQSRFRATGRAASGRDAIQRAGRSPCSRRIGSSGVSEPAGSSRFRRTADAVRRADAAGALQLGRATWRCDVFCTLCPCDPVRGFLFPRRKRRAANGPRLVRRRGDADGRPYDLSRRA